MKKGFASEKEACDKAVSLKLVGLTGSGQQCGPELLPDGSFCYHTAHSVFGGEPSGKYLLPTGLVDYDDLFTGNWAKY